MRTLIPTGVADHIEVADDIDTITVRLMSPNSANSEELMTEGHLRLSGSEWHLVIDAVRSLLPAEERA